MIRHVWWPLARIRVDEQLVVAVLAQHLAVNEVGPDGVPRRDRPHLLEAVGGLDGERHAVDDPEATHPDDRRVEGVVVLLDLAVGVGGGERGGVGRAVGRLDADHLPVADHEVQRAHRVGDRPEGDPGPVGRGAEHAGHGLGVIAAHVRQRQPALVQRFVEGAQAHAGLHPHERRAVDAVAQQRRLAVGHGVQTMRLDEEPGRQRDVGPRVPGADRAHRGALVLRALDDRDELSERRRLEHRKRIDPLVAGVVPPLGAASGTREQAHPAGEPSTQIPSM